MIPRKFVLRTFIAKVAKNADKRRLVAKTAGLLKPVNMIVSNPETK